MKILLLAFLAFAAPMVMADPISFEKLPAGDSIHITFLSAGCFHSGHYEFDFQRSESSALTVQVALLERVWNEKKQAYEKPARHVLGTLTLAEDDVAKLEGLLRFYRSPPRNGCTTVDTIQAIRKVRGKAREAESYTDGSCSTYEMKNVLTLDALVNRFETPKKKP